MNQELNRLATYDRWPPSSHGWPSRLARHGFYAMQDGEKAMCFSCRISVERWEEGEDPREKHQQDCSEVNGHNSTNVMMVPLPDNFGRDIRIAGSTAGLDVIDSSVAVASPQPSDFLQACRLARERAARKGLLGQTAPVFDPENPDFLWLKREAARLSTFGGFPPNCAVTPAALARSGFFYKGPRDRVQCAFCRGLLRNWVPGDDPMAEHRRHMADCAFVNDPERAGNVRIENDNSVEVLTVELQRQQLDHVVREPPLDHTQPQAGQQQQTGNVDREAPLDHVNTQPQATFSTLTSDYKHPQYATDNTRRTSFLADGVDVPRGQTIDGLVDAGFFFVGPGDNVRCFCCAIGLRNWQHDDNAWVEHARWSPRCSYVVSRRDAAFIEDARRGQTAAASEKQFSLQSSLEAGNEGDNMMPADGVFQMCDWSADGHSSRAENSSMATPSHAAAASVMGSSANEQNLAVGLSPAAAAATSRPRSRRNKKKTVSETTVPSGSDDAEEDSEAAADVANDSNDETADAEAETLLEENRQLKEARRCRVCLDQDINVVFLPCGHLVCCDSCAPALRNCAVCRSLIRGTVKVFLS